MTDAASTQNVFATVRPLVERPPTSDARVVLGMTVYNGAAHLTEALETVLAQEFEDFVLVILDDASQDDSPEIIKRLVADRPNVHAYRNLERKGMVGTWADIFHLSRLIAPSHTYFGWCADHDVLFPSWLGRLVEVLDQHPKTVVSYALASLIDIGGKPMKKGLDPSKLSKSEAVGGTPFGRFIALQHRGRGFGNIIYGLMRSDALERVGVFRPVLVPDRLAVLELSLFGEVRCVPEVLRQRRQTSAFSLERQKRSLFPPGRPPPWIHVPHFVVHSAVTFRAYQHPDARPPGVTAVQVWLMSLDLIIFQLWRQSFDIIKKHRKHARARSRLAKAAQAQEKVPKPPKPSPESEGSSPATPT